MLLVSLLLLIGLLLLAVPVAAALGILGLSLDFLFFDGFLPLYISGSGGFWDTSTGFLLVAIPLFILLGEIMLRSGIAEKMYTAMSHWLTWLPGGLMHSNIGASALFAATSGSSVATAATIGTVAEPQIDQRNYNRPLFLGTLAVGGTLGILIPPSLNMIIYGVLTDTSIPKLYLAGIIPGLMLAGLFILTILIACLLKKEWGGDKIEASWDDRIGSLKHLLVPLFIFAVVIFSIYLGWATATESAALGVLCAMILAVLNRTLTWEVMASALEGTMRTTSMVILIILAAHFLNYVLANIGLSQTLTNYVASLGLTSTETLLAVVVFYVVLGFFMETLTLMVTTIPIIAPIIIDGAGYDPVWFGILLMLLIETALITPPIGLNLYVIQGIRTDNGSLNDVIVGSLPFVLVLFLMIALVIIFPGIVIYR